MEILFDEYTSKNLVVGSVTEIQTDKIDGEFHEARVRVTAVVGPVEIPADASWYLRENLEKRTTYRGEVICSRASGVPAASNAIGQHAANLASGT